MNSDLQSLLADAAPTPPTPLDLEAVFDRGARLRLRRRAMLATALVAAIGLAVEVPKTLPPRAPTVLSAPGLDGPAGDLLAAPGRTQVWVADADGSDPRPLTDWPGRVLPLDWSPDGRWLLVQSDRDGDWDLWLVARDGSSEVQLTDEPGMESFARFSPSGGRVAFTDNLAVDADLWVVGVDGQGMRKVAGGAGTDEWLPAWSPDGDTLVFARTPRDALVDSALWTTTPEGTNEHRIDTGTRLVLWADWAQDGSRLLVATVGGTLLTMSPDGSEVTPLVGIDLAWHPRWAPDGTITFARGGHEDSSGLLRAGPDAPRDLWTVDADGGGARPLLVRSGDQSLPVWSPDGMLVAFAESSGAAT